MSNEWKYPNIPKIMFTYWSGPVSYLHYLCLKSFIDFNPGWQVQLYYPKCPSTLVPSWKNDLNSIPYTGKDWYDELKKLNISFIAVDFNEIGFSNSHNEIIKSDYLRLYILATQGGVWSDTDILYFKPMNSLVFDEHLINGGLDQTDTVISFYQVRSFYSIGFLMAGKNNQFFNYILNKTKNNLNTQRYESIGSELYKKLFNNTSKIVQMFPNLNIVNMGLDFVYPVPYWHTNEIFYGKLDINFECSDPMLDEIKWDNEQKWREYRRYPLNCSIKSKANRFIGIHWFNGHGKAKQFINEENYDSDVTINNIIKKYLV